MVTGFVLVGHWGGIIWYWCFIIPLEKETMDQLKQRAIELGNVTLREAAMAMPGDEWLYPNGRDIGGKLPAGEWWWIIAEVDPSKHTESILVRWVCSLYWALSVMTNLKGVAHESRECLP